MIVETACSKDEGEVTALLFSHGLGPEFLPGEFLVARVERELVGCVRLKELSEGVEVCSLAVKDEFQGYGVGTRLVEECMRGAAGPVYCLTYIPEFFGRLDFREVEKGELPGELSEKCEYYDQLGKGWVAMKKPNP